MGKSVTPCAGVWIEIAIILYRFYFNMSLPVRECGLKYSGRIQKDVDS